MKIKCSKIITRSMCNIKCTGQKDMDTHIRRRAFQTRERQAKLASVNQQLDFYYMSLATAALGSDRALCGVKTAPGIRATVFR